METVKIIEATISSLVAASLIALVIWIASWVRNILLENTLKKGITPNGIGTGYDPGTKKGSFNIQINNLSNVNIRIRKVLLIGAEGQAHIELKYEKDKGIYQTPLLNMLLQPTFKVARLARGFTDNAEIEEYVKLPPKTMAIWSIEPNRLSEKKWFAKEIIVAIEYPTIFGNTALIKLSVTNDFIKRARDCLHEVIKSVHNDTGLELPTAIQRKIDESKHNKANK